MDENAYNSQQEAITLKANERNIALEELNAVFDQKFDSIVQDHPVTRPAWRLGRAEYLVWEHYCEFDAPITFSSLQGPYPVPNEPFPGTSANSDSRLPEMGKNKQRDTDRYRPMDKMAMNTDWVHDKYQGDSPDRQENIDSRKADYHNGSAKRPVGPIDSYRPALGSDSESRDAHSCRPVSKDWMEGYDISRYAVDIPTSYHTLLGYIVEKALAVGVSPDAFCSAYYRNGQKAKDDKPTASAYWLMWRHECLIWKQFFPEERFIGAEPKLKPTTRDTENTRFSLIESSKLWRMMKSSPAFGRLTKDNHAPKPAPTGPSGVATKATLPAASTSTNGAQNNLQPSQLMRARALAGKVTDERLQAVYKEKQKLVTSHSNQSEEWQQWFVEATTWSHLFKDDPFPCQEPRLNHSLRGNRSIVPKDYVFSYVPQEKAMEQMAIKRGIRREFFKYLNAIRHDAIAIYPLCICYARNFLADRLTWQKFFRESFPVEWPLQDHRRDCRASAQARPFSTQTQIVAATRKSSTIKAEESKTIAQATKPSNVALKPPSNSAVVEMEESATVILLPHRSTAALKEAMAPGTRVAPVAAQLQRQLLDPLTVQKDLPDLRPVSMAPPAPPAPPQQLSSSKVSSHTIESRPSCDPRRTSSLQASPHSPCFQGQEIDVPTLSAQSCLQPSQNQGLPIVSCPPREIEAQSSFTGSSPTQGSRDFPPPASILAALMETRKNHPMLPNGVLVMQNMDVAIFYNSDTVAQMYHCLLAENAASITSINHGLKCHFRCRRHWNGDLLLWVEPYTLGDTTAFSGGHLFLKGWVQRNLGFGVVQPSFYWNEIQNTASFKQAAITPIQAHDRVSPTKPDHGNGASSIKNVLDAHGATDSTHQNFDAVLVIQSKYAENVRCSRAALKNLAFSFVIDSSKEKVEQKLGCKFTLQESKGNSKSCGRELDLVVKPLPGTSNEQIQKATIFLRAWSLRAMQFAPCKSSTFLVCPEGLRILATLPSPSTMPANDVLEKPSCVPENTHSLYRDTDLDLLLSEETAKAEGSLRLVLDEVTGTVISLRELLKKTLHRASAKILESSAVDESGKDEDDDDEVQVYGTAGQMKNMGGGRFIVVKTPKHFEATRFSNGKHNIVEDCFGDSDEKRMCNFVTKGGERKESDKEKLTIVAAGRAKQNSMREPATAPPENDLGPAETLEPTFNGKRKAEDADLQDRVEKKVCV